MDLIPLSKSKVWDADEWCELDYNFKECSFVFYGDKYPGIGLWRRVPGSGGPIRIGNFRNIKLKTK